MSIDVRRDRDRDDRERRYGSGGRGSGTHVSGANALRINLFDDDDFDADEFDVILPRAARRRRRAADRLDDVDGRRVRAGWPGRTPARTALTRSSAPRTTTAPDTTARVSAATAPARDRTARRTVARNAPRPARVPRPRRGRTPWVSDVTVTEPAATPRRRAKAGFAVFLIGLVVVGVAGVLVLNTKINENSFRLGDLRQTQAALSLQEQQLQQQLADLESPGNLRAAATRLGLVPAGSPAYISLPDGRVVGVPQPASSDTTTEP
jgi:hypothetical protein